MKECFENRIAKVHLDADRERVDRLGDSGRWSPSAGLIAARLYGDHDPGVKDGKIGDRYFSYRVVDTRKIDCPMQADHHHDGATGTRVRVRTEVLVI